MLAFALRNDGWYLRQDIIWHRPNCMTESVKDRCTKSHEYVFLLTKDKKYFFDAEAIREPSTAKGYTSKNKRDVWSIPTKPIKEAHYATFPIELIKLLVMSGCPKGGLVLDPFIGVGTTAIVASQLERDYVGIDLNSEYIEIANNRILNTIKDKF